jgi:LAO/AO transport system kinase
MSLVEDVLLGNRLALARLLTQIENGSETGRKALDELFAHAGKAHLIGVTGAPGTGKSTLVNQIARAYRNPAAGPPRQVGIVAVDPTSPFSGGAILGDRVRMRDLSGDPGVFIRSMASRGSLGGLAAATSGVVQALDAAGFEVILIETVGAGQAEVEIARLAHTTLVIEAPGLGDDIQAIKAGILEIADLLVINKADRPGVEASERALLSMLQLAHPKAHVFRNNFSKPGHFSETVETAQAEDQCIPPVLRTTATDGSGILELSEAIEQHRQYLERSGELAHRERERLVAELNLLVRELLVSRWRERLPDAQYHGFVARLVQREISPWQAAQGLLEASTAGA